MFGCRSLEIFQKKTEFLKVWKFKFGKKFGMQGLIIDRLGPERPTLFLRYSRAFVIALIVITVFDSLSMN